MEQSWQIFVEPLLLLMENLMMSGECLYKEIKMNDEGVVSYLEKFVEQLQLIDFDCLVGNGE